VNTTLQVVSSLLMLAIVGFIVRMVRARRLRAKYSFLWLLVGTVIIVLVLVPGLLDRTARAAGVAYPPALLFLGAIVLLLLVAVHFSWELSRIEERSRTVIEELALVAARVDELEAAAQAPERHAPPVPANRPSAARVPSER
jgi:hypothetical protein